MHAASSKLSTCAAAGSTALRVRVSGGQRLQKLILGRALLPPTGVDGRADAPAPRLIVAHQPTWGLDIGAVRFVQQQLVAARDAGAAVLLISDDLDEVIALGDRIAVLHAGALSPVRPAHAWTRASIGLAMAGGVAGKDGIDSDIENTHSHPSRPAAVP